MIKKDFTIQENMDHEKKQGREDENLSIRNTPDDNTGKTYVKNAHAAGDGAFGRTETSVPDEAGNVENEDEDAVY